MSPGTNRNNLSKLSDKTLSEKKKSKEKPDNPKERELFIMPPVPTNNVTTISQHNEQEDQQDQSLLPRSIRESRQSERLNGGDKPQSTFQLDLDHSPIFLNDPDSTPIDFSKPQNLAKNPDQKKLETVESQTLQENAN